MKKQRMKFISAKRKVIGFTGPSKYPRRSQAEWRIIERKPFGDADRDGVYNFFDCKPLNRRKQDQLKFDASGKVIVPGGYVPEKRAKFGDLPETEKERIIRMIRIKKWRQKQREDEAYARQLKKLQRGDIDI